jgi:hypothetical protein
LSLTRATAAKKKMFYNVDIRDMAGSSRKIWSSFFPELVNLFFFVMTSKKQTSYSSMLRSGKVEYPSFKPKKQEKILVRVSSQLTLRFYFKKSAMVEKPVKA